MATTKEPKVPQAVKIEPGDKVCVSYEAGPCTGIVSIVADGQCIIGFDDGTEDTVRLDDVKLISKAGTQVTSDDVTDSTKKPSGTVSPNAQQLEQQANMNRQGKVDAANRAAATRDTARDAENAGKPLTADEKTFVAKVKARLNGRQYRSNDVMVSTARMTSLPSSADMTRYARLVRQMEG